VFSPKGGIIILKKVPKTWEPEFKKTDPMERKRKANGKKKGSKKKGPRIPEDVIQGEVDAYLKELGVKAIRMPNALFIGIYAIDGIPQWIKTLVSNYLAGLPDLIIPLITEKGTLILALELKAIDGVIGPKQRKWEKVLNTKYAYSTEEAKTLIDDFLKGG